MKYVLYFIMKIIFTVIVIIMFAISILLNFIWNVSIKKIKKDFAGLNPKYINDFTNDMLTQEFWTSFEQSEFDRKRQLKK